MLVCKMMDDFNFGKLTKVNHEGALMLSEAKTDPLLKKCMIMVNSFPWSFLLKVIPEKEKKQVVGTLIDSLCKMVVLTFHSDKLAIAS